MDLCWLMDSGKTSTIMKFINYTRRLRRLQWVGHVMMKDEQVSKKAMKGYSEGRRPAERPSRRWSEAVNTDAKRILKCRNRRRSAEDGNAWRKRTEEAKAYVWL
jgi:hypothetical protein